MSDEVNNAVIECKNVKMRYKDAGQDLEILHGINFTVADGELVSIVGTSGSGKSTLLHLLAGLEQASEGEIMVAGQAVRPMSKTQRALLRQTYLGFVYQLHHLLPEFSAMENVAMPLLLAGVPKKNALKKADYWLTRVAMDHRKTHRPNTLSGGERQRVAIARALVTDPKCVLADEPTGNLDSNTAQQVQSLIQELNQTGTSFIIVTHDRRFAQLARSQYEMVDGVLKLATERE